jgi:hypothetical protein
MNLRVIAGGGLMATAALTMGLIVGGFGSAAAQPVDYSTLPIHPNAITDSSAYTAAAPVPDPNGQPGVMEVYTHRDGTRQITNTILVLPDAQAATAATDEAKALLAGKVVNSTTTPSQVGTGGTIVSGSSPDGSKSISVLTFTQGNAATTIEFDGPRNDPAPVDMVTDFGQQQANALRNALSV